MDIMNFSHRAKRLALAATALVQCAAFQPAIHALTLRSRHSRSSPVLPRMAASGTEFSAFKCPKQGDRVRHEFDVFIEDTDCFGVVYNANYLKFFDRARQNALGVAQLAALQCERHAGGGGGQFLRLHTNKEIKLSGSAVLGQQIEVCWFSARGHGRVPALLCKHALHNYFQQCNSLVSIDRNDVANNNIYQHL